MTERDWLEWLTILDPKSGEMLFRCDHNGNGDHGWFWYASGVSHGYAKNLDELFSAASWVWHKHMAHAELISYWKPEFLAWWNENAED